MRRAILSVLMLAGSVAMTATVVTTAATPAGAAVTSHLNGPISAGQSGDLPNGVHYAITAGTTNMFTITTSQPVTIGFGISSLQCLTPPPPEGVFLPPSSTPVSLNPHHAFDPSTGLVYGITGSANGDVSTFETTDPATTFSFTHQSGAACGAGVTYLDVTAFQADLGLTKTGPARLSPGTSGTWNLTVSNAGPDASTGYTVTDALPAGTTGISSTTPGCSVAGTTVTCTGGALAAGQSSAITITGTPGPANLGSTYTNSASIAGQNVDGNTANDTASSATTIAFPPAVCRAASLSLLGATLGKANLPTNPCVQDDQTVVDATVALGTGALLSGNPLLTALVPQISVKGLQAATKTGTANDNAILAGANLAAATISLPGLVIKVGALESLANAFHPGDCNVPAIVGGQSSIASLTINGSRVLIGDQSITIPLVVGSLSLNQTVRVGDTVTQRALFLDLPGTALDVVLGEAVAGVTC